MASQPQDGKQSGKTRVPLKEWYDLEYGYDGQIHYHYADELPCAFKLYTVLSVIGSIIATPLILLCCIPNLKSIKKVE
jgi:hypothetical protein